MSMKITEITYSKGQTLQLRQFEPTNIHYSAKAEVEAGEDIAQAYGELKKIVDEMVGVDTEMLTGNTGKLVRAAAKQVLAKQKSPF